MDIVTGMSIMYTDALIQARELIYTLACYALFITFSVWAGMKMYNAVKWVATKGIRKEHRAAFLIWGAVATVLAQKVMTGSVSYPYTDIERKYFLDNGSYVTNDYVCVSFRSIGVPASADFQGWVRPIGSTNDDEWVQFFVSTVGEISCPTNIPYEGAISNNFQFFSTWVDGPTVHTNGVLNVKWGVHTNDMPGVVGGLPIQTEIHIDDAVIATPASIYTNDVEFLNLNNLNLLSELYDEN